jgi:hypothetical protein
MKTVSLRNFKLLGGQGKTDGWSDKLIPVYHPYNFVVREYNYFYSLLHYYMLAGVP